MKTFKLLNKITYSGIIWLGLTMTANASSPPNVALADIQLDSDSSLDIFFNADPNYKVDKAGNDYLKNHFSQLEAQIKQAVVASKPNELSATITNQDNCNLLLTGQVLALSAGEELNLIPDSNHYSNIYGFTVAIEYKLFDKLTNRLISSFTVAGLSGEASLQTSKANPSLANYEQLFNQVTAQLSKQVVEQLQNQLKQWEQTPVSASSSPPAAQ